jgi:hypothetical protein
LLIEQLENMKKPFGFMGTYYQAEQAQQQPAAATQKMDLLKATQ